MFFKEITENEILALPNSRLKSRLTGEYSSSCPVCGGVDRFIYWSKDGGYWCRQCGLRGKVTDKKSFFRLPQAFTSSTPEFPLWYDYHTNLVNNSNAMKYWELALGSQYETAVFEFGLGFCDDFRSMGPSFTIPLGYCGKVFGVKHRLVKPAKAKYIVEPQGCKTILFNLDNVLKYDKIAVVEGEKKAMRLWLEGYPTVSGSAGAGSFPDSWSVFFIGKEVVIIPDPDQAGQHMAEKLQAKLGGQVINLPDKVDDFINSGGDITKYLGEPWR